MRRGRRTPWRRSAYGRAASRSRTIVRSPRAALRKPRGETPAARWKVRTKFERSPKPTSNATSVIERAVVGEQARRVAQARAHQVLVRRHAEHAREESQEVERAEAGLAPRCSRSIGSCERASIQSAGSTARRRSRAPAVGAARASGPRRPRRSAPRTACRPRRARRRCRPRPTACASSPSTISSGSGGTAAGAPDLGATADRSTSAGASWNDRHSSPTTCSCVHTYSSPGWPTRSEPAPARTPRRARDSRSCPCARTADRSRRAARRTARRRRVRRRSGSRSPRARRSARASSPARLRIAAPRREQPAGWTDQLTSAAKRRAPSGSAGLDVSGLPSSSARHRYQLATVR